MDTFGYIGVLSILLCITFQVATSQIQGCSLLGINIQECMVKDENSASLDSCCKTLNHAVQAGYYCLCLLLRSSTPLLGITLSLQLSNCYISVPPLTQCQNSLPIFPTPLTPLPALSNPPTRPVPVQKPPELPQDLPQLSAPNEFAVPLPPKRDEIPVSSTPIDNSSAAAGHPTSISNLHPNFDIHELGDMKSNSGDKMKYLLRPRHLLPIVLCAIM